MSKLQMIRRANGTESYSCNLPLALVKDIGWSKGDDVTIEIIDSKFVISREVEDGIN